MLALLGATTLMLVAGRWVLPAASGKANLKSENVEIHIIDDDFFLKWNSSSESVKNVTFSADYQILYFYSDLSTVYDKDVLKENVKEAAIAPLRAKAIIIERVAVSPEQKGETWSEGTDNWKKLPGCQHITSTKCSFSSVELKNVFEKIELRIRAEEGNNTSTWYEVEPFVPFLEAQIGPPDVHLEAEDKAIILSISPPGTEDSIMWALDRLSFRYSVVIWKNSSSLEERTETVYPEDKIYKLSPEITYCLKVKAELRLQNRVGCYSPVYCINTTERHKVPSPENIQINVDNQTYVLKWDYPYESATFQAQWLRAFLKKIPGKHSNKWKQIPNCENVTATHCVFPRDIFSRGIYCVRVRASNGNGTSFWSEEKEFNTEMKTILFPPVISMKSITDDSLHVIVGASEESVNQFYPLVYEVIFWENTSNAERKVLEKRTDFTFPNLKPLTVYCVKARALIENDRRNKGSSFSDTVCEKTKPGNTSQAWLIAGICTALLSVPVAIYVVSVFLRCVKYVFFPSSKPPSSVDEYFSDQPLRNLLLSTFEEKTERCFIIENASIITEIEETNEIDEVHEEYNSQASQDSGNYSNEDENSGSKISEEFLQQDSV